MLVLISILVIGLIVGGVFLIIKAGKSKNQELLPASETKDTPLPIAGTDRVSSTSTPAAEETNSGGFKGSITVNPVIKAAESSVSDSTVHSNLVIERIYLAKIPGDRWVCNNCDTENLYYAAVCSVCGKANQ